MGEDLLDQPHVFHHVLDVEHLLRVGIAPQGQYVGVLGGAVGGGGVDGGQVDPYGASLAWQAGHVQGAAHALRKVTGQGQAQPVKRPLQLPPPPRSPAACPRHPP